MWVNQKLEGNNALLGMHGRATFVGVCCQRESTYCLTDSGLLLIIEDNKQLQKTMDEQVCQIHGVGTHGAVPSSVRLLTFRLLVPGVWP